MGKEIFIERTAENGARYLYISTLEESFPVRTFFTTKNGGVSKGAFESLNLGYNTDDNPDDVTTNRNMVFNSMGIDGPIIAFPQQVHNDSIAVIDEDASENRILKFPKTDATVTNRKGVILTSLHADCIPVWLYDPVKHVAGVAHAGWRGTRLNIAVKTANKMCSKYGCRMKDIIAVIGPGIGKCCFEVGFEVYAEFCDMLGDLGNLAVDDKNGKYHLDLKGINRLLLQNAGVGEVLASGYCTVCEKDLFYSYRRDNGVTGRMCAGIVLM